MSAAATAGPSATATTAPLLEARGISRTFGSLVALNDVDIQVNAGEVVGLVGDGKYQNIMEDPQPWFYIPLNQEFQSLRAIVVRSSVSPDSLISEVEHEIRALAPGMPLFNSASGEQVLDQAEFVFRLGVYLAGGMGLLGLFIAVVGVYGVVSYSALQRTREVGIRVALGAMPGDVLKLILRHGLTLIGAGVVAGVIVGLVVTRAISHIFHGGTGVSSAAMSTVRDCV